jgi:type II secretory pathway pseudopilin PulG
MGRLPRSTIRTVGLVFVAVAIVALGAVALISQFRAQVSESRRGLCEAILSQLTQAQKTYQLDHGDYPPRPASLNDGQNSRGRIYFDYKVNGEKRVVADPWGRPFLYRENRSNYSIVLYSVGPNGIDESGKADDVTSE